MANLQEMLEEGHSKIQSHAIFTVLGKGRRANAPLTQM